MRNGEIIYFTEVEFELMLELSEGGKYSIFRSGAALEDVEITRAIHSLFIRRMLRRVEDRFIPNGEGKAFRDIRRAPYVLTLVAFSPNRGSAVVYLAMDRAWIAEYVTVGRSGQIRLREAGLEDARQWIVDAGYLEPPTLTDEDTVELNALLSDGFGSEQGQPLLRLEKYVNGGGLLRSYELWSGARGKWICSTEKDLRKNMICTQEAVTQMLEVCFGEERQ